MSLTLYRSARVQAWTDKLKTNALRATARAGNAVYKAVSAVQSGRMARLRDRHPAAFVLPPEQVEYQSTKRIPPALQRVLFHSTEGVEVPIAKLEAFVRDGLSAKLFVHYGSIVYINHRRMNALFLELGRIEELSDAAIDEAKFFRESSSRGLIRTHLFSGAQQLEGAMQADYVETSRGEYRLRDYAISTRDARPLKLRGIIKTHRVKAGDNSPSVLLLNGVACENGSLNLNAGESFVYDIADRGRWVYQLDNRGIGQNAGKDDANVYLDTHVSNDGPAAVEFISQRPGIKKPLVLVGYSMGGMIAEFMVIRHAYKLNAAVEELAVKTDTQAVTTKAHTRKEVEEYLDSLKSEEEASEDVAALCAEARSYLEILNGIKGIITVGAPKIFDKNSHPAFPALLMLSQILPYFHEEKVPMNVVKWLVKHFPIVANAARLMINSDNFDDPEKFLSDYIVNGTGSFPLGVGLQFLINVYSGKGFRRMGKTRFNYSRNIDLIPKDLPVFHIVGSQDILCPKYNLGFIDPKYRTDDLDFSLFPKYSHSSQGVTEITKDTEVAGINILSGPQVHGFMVEGVGHLDLLEGKTAMRATRPLIHRLIENIWLS